MEIDLSHQIIEELKQSALHEDVMVLDSFTQQIKREESKHVDMFILEQQTRLTHTYNHLQHMFGLFLAKDNEIDEQLDQLSCRYEIYVLIRKARADDLSQTLIFCQFTHIAFVFRKK